MIAPVRKRIVAGEFTTRTKSPSISTRSPVFPRNKPSSMPSVRAAYRTTGLEPSSPYLTGGTQIRTNHACVIQRQSSQFARRVEQRVRPSALDRIHLLVNQRVYTTAEDVPPYEWKTPLERSIRAPQEAPRSHVPRQPRIWSDFHDHHQLCGPCISRRGRHLICVDQHR